jgi:DNA-binding CsgD family transcriptional regulator
VLYAPGLTLENYAARCFEFVSRLVGKEFVAFGSLNTATMKLDIGFDTAVPEFPRAMAAFGQMMMQYPLYSWDPKVNGGKPFYRSDFFTARQFRQLDIYQDCMRLLPSDDHCAIHVPSGPGEIAFFGIERWRGAEFSGRDRTLIGLAQQHLTNARQLARLRAEDDIEGVDPARLAQAGLTAREADVLTWVSEGKTNVEIATILRINAQTVKDHVSAIFAKIHAPNRLAATLWALRVSRTLGQAGGHQSNFVKVPVRLLR